ncbi:ELL-associated factor [Carabus blaptoides fortunei]
MADKLGLGPEVRQLKLGSSFTNPRSSSFHTIRYDFKPASVDINKMATVDVGNSNQVTVTVPHLDGAGIPQTLFKGSQRPYQKECVLIIDRVTGEISLEKLASNMQVKKTRAEAYKASSGSAHPSARPQTPVDQTPITQRSSSKTKVTSGSRRNPTSVGLIPKHSPLHASPSHHPSPSHGPPPKPSVERMENLGPSTLASLPMIGLDDISDPVPVLPVKTPPSHHSDEEQNGGVGILSDSSSSSSSDSGSSDSESEPEAGQNNGTLRATNGKSPPAAAPAGISVPDRLLNEDLCLSESATDSD